MILFNCEISVIQKAGVMRKHVKGSHKVSYLKKSKFQVVLVKKMNQEFSKSGFKINPNSSSVSSINRIQHQQIITCLKKVKVFRSCINWFTLNFLES